MTTSPQPTNSVNAPALPAQTARVWLPVFCAAVALVVALAYAVFMNVHAGLYFALMAASFACCTHLVGNFAWVKQRMGRQKIVGHVTAANLHPKTKPWLASALEVHYAYSVPESASTGLVVRTGQDVVGHFYTPLFADEQLAQLASGQPLTLWVNLDEPEQSSAQIGGTTDNLIALMLLAAAAGTFILCTVQWYERHFV